MHLKHKEMNIKNIFAVLSLVIILTSCSSISNMKFWQSEEVDDDEPKLLKNFSESKKIILNWTSSFNGINTLGNFPPSISGGNLFFADPEGRISSIDPISGVFNWTIESNKTLSSGVSSGFNIITVSDTDGYINAYTQSDGTLLWSANTKGEVLSPSAISAKYVVVKTGSGELLAVDRISGDLKWSYRSKLPTLTIRGSSSPVILEDKVYAVFDNGRIGVFDLNSGFPIWDGAISYVTGSSELESLIDADASPLIEGGLIYSANYQGSLTIFDLAQKRAVWQSEASSFFTPLIIKSLIVLVESNSNLKSFSTQTLQESWSTNEYTNRILSNPSNFGGYILVGDFEGYVHVIDPLNGKTIGRKKISKKAIKSIISRSKNFYVVDEALNIFSLSI